MNDQWRWIVGGIVAMVGTMLAFVLSLQASVDASQDAAISGVSVKSEQRDTRQDQLIDRTTQQQFETAAALREVARALDMIDERGTRAFIEASKK